MHGALTRWRQTRAGQKNGKVMGDILLVCMYVCMCHGWRWQDLPLR